MAEVREASSVVTSDNATTFYAERLGLADEQASTEAESVKKDSEPEGKVEQSEPEAKEEAKLEEEAEEDREIPEEPEQTVYVKVHVEGGVPSDAEGKPKLETPNFVLIGTTYEQFAKYGNSWQEGLWTRPIVGMFGVQMLNQILKDAEVEYDAIEDNGLTWGNDWDAIREALADNPAPFNKYALFHIKWRPEDLQWEESAKQAYDTYNFRYTRDELLKDSKRSLQVIAKIKGLGTGGDEGALIDSIAAFNPAEVEEEEAGPEQHIYCAGGSCLLLGAYEKFNLPVPKLPEAGWQRPKAAVIKCINKKTNTVISEEEYCDICAASLEIGEYPGGTVFPSMYPVREYDNTICRRLWLPGGEELVKKLVAGRRVSKDEGNYLILGSRAIKMANDSIEEFSMRIKGLSGNVHVDYKELFSHWDVVPPELKERLKKIMNVGLENPSGLGPTALKQVQQDRDNFVRWLNSNESLTKIAFKLGWKWEESPPEATASAADLLAQEALKELAEDALRELRGL